LNNTFPLLPNDLMDANNRATIPQIDMKELYCKTLISTDKCIKMSVWLKQEKKYLPMGSIQ